MAEVYEVRDPASGERMALKLLAETKSSSSGSTASSRR
jgi:hypothetical protein